jgi:hypothetical protein
VKKYLPLFSLFVIVLAASCRKESIITSKDARLSIGSDTIRFDTVFAAAGSIANYFIIRNENKQAIRISNIQLMGGAASMFKVNVDGSPGSQFSNLEIEGNDSMYVFITVNANPNNDLLPFIIKDSIKVEWNGNTSFKQLEAWGQNARYLRNAVITGNVTWNKDLPYVILGGLRVDTTASLTIASGTRIHLNADAPFIVDGTLTINGTKSDSVVFRSNRLDEPYRDFPGGWPGIYFRSASKNNVLTYTYILNAYQGIIAQEPSGSATPKVTLNNCVIDHIFDIGLFGINTNMTINNSLISNCGTNVALIYGGNYQFTHTTVAAYSDSYITHKNPAVLATNFIKQNNQTFTNPITATFTNCIIWGTEGFVDNEIVVQKEGTAAAAITLQHVLFRAKADPANTNFVNVLRNQDPAFDSIDVVKRFYNFRLKELSPAINKGILTPLSTDFDGFPRVGLPDLGCFEKQ